MKRFIACVSAVVLCAGAFVLPQASDTSVVDTVSVSADSVVVASGTFSTLYLRWSLTDDGTLTITGTVSGMAIGDITINPAYEYKDQITKLVIGTGVGHVGDNAFRGYPNLKEVYISKDLLDVDRTSFSDCESLENFVVEEGNGYYYSLDGALIAKANKSPTDADAILFYAPANPQTTYTIPDSVDFIAGNAFENAKNLTEVVFPLSAVSIGEKAFYGCTSLTNVVFNNGVYPYGFVNKTVIASYSFQNTGLTDVKVLYDYASIGTKAFGYDVNGNKIDGFIVYAGAVDTAGYVYALNNGFKCISLRTGEVLLEANDSIYVSDDDSSTLTIGDSDGKVVIGESETTTTTTTTTKVSSPATGDNGVAGLSVLALTLGASAWVLRKKK